MPSRELPEATSRLTFRAWSPHDGPLAIRLWCDPVVTRLITASGTLSEDEALARLQAEIDCRQRHGVQYWPVFSADQHIGCCGLRPREPAANVWELGFHIRSALWGRGYAGEAAAAVVRFAFDRLGAAALFAGHHPDNHASRRVLERLGFRHTHDEFYPPTGLLHRSYLLDQAPGGCPP